MLHQVDAEPLDQVRGNEHPYARSGFRGIDLDFPPTRTRHDRYTPHGLNVNITTAKFQHIT